MTNKLNIESFSRRLIIVRRMRGFSIKDFHSMLNEFISYTDYKVIEDGLIAPTNELFLLIATKLEISPRYLLKPIQVDIERIDFENLQYLNQSDQSKLINYTRFHLERIIVLENKLSPRQTCLEKLKELTIENSSDIEVAATRFRELLGIGYKSIANLSRLLEEENIKIIPYTKLKNFESTSTCFDLKHYVIVFNNNIEHHTVEDSRLFLLKEVAYLFLNLSAFQEEKRHELCMQFALAVLLPLNFVQIYFGDKRSNIYTNELRYINSYFGISPIAILYRIFYLKIITKWRFNMYRANYNKNFDYLKANDYKGTEDLYGFDHLLIQAIVNKKITEFEAAEFSNQNYEDFQMKYLDCL
jgi:Zn-dependent peptidase ImmA (M78 family)